MIVRRISLCCLALLLAGCELPAETYSQANRRYMAEAKALRTMESERATLVVKHNQRLSSYSDQREIDDLQSGHQMDLAQVDLAIGRQRDHLDWVKARRDALTD